MKPQYVTIIGGTPKVVPLDTNMVPFNVSIRTDATTVELALEAPADSVAANSFTPTVGPAPTWVAAPAAGANGVIVLKDPYAAVRFTKATNGLATVLQSGLR